MPKRWLCWKLRLAGNLLTERCVEEIGASQEATLWSIAGGDPRESDAVISSTEVRRCNPQRSGLN
jgi:hypothetical protein